MENQFSRTENLIGTKNLNKLKNAKIAVFGIGGVGGYVIEALARSGVENLTIIDNDTISITNLNRQIIATHSTLSQPKTQVMKERILDINPNANVITHNTFYLPKNSAEFDFSQYNYIVDAIDTVTSKIELITKAKECNTPIISCMGTGNKLDPTKFEIADISKTSVCPLAKVMRYELKKRNIKNVKVLYSKEPPVKTESRTPMSNATCPAVAGLIIANQVILDIIKQAET